MGRRKNSYLVVVLFVLVLLQRMREELWLELGLGHCSIRLCCIMFSGLSCGVSHEHGLFSAVQFGDL